MNTSGWLQLGLYVVVLLLLAKPLGAYMAAVYEGRAAAGAAHRRLARAADLPRRRRRSRARHGLDRLRAGDALVQPRRRAGRLRAAARCSSGCRSIRRHMAAVSPDSSFNTATSFITNTNWQGYGGESTMSYLTQMLALAVQNFVSAATGMAVLVALIRGFVAQGSERHRQLLDRSRPHDRLHPAAACRSSSRSCW